MKKRNWKILGAHLAVFLVFGAICFAVARAVPVPVTKTATTEPTGDEAPSYAELRAISDSLDQLHVLVAPDMKPAPETLKIYNGLADAYNEAMRKSNYRYTRPADLPPGEIWVLPRSYDLIK